MNFNGTKQYYTVVYSASVLYTSENFEFQTPRLGLNNDTITHAQDGLAILRVKTLEIDTDSLTLCRKRKLN